MSTASQLFGSLKDLARQGSPPGMTQDLIRLTVERILKNKILLGLVIVGILGIFVGGFSPSHDERSAGQRIESASVTSQKEKLSSASSSSYSMNEPLDAAFATDFVKWWIGQAMDYSTATAKASHATAFRWMTPEAQASFQAIFWPSDLANAIAQGQIVAAFQPVTVQPEAINPDGSIVVGVLGTLIMQTSTQPTTQQIIADLLVVKDQSGLRIAGLYNRSRQATLATNY